MVVNGTCAPSVTSDDVTLSVIEAPSIEDMTLTIPAICEGNGTGTFTVTATGAGLTYQWRKGTVNLVNNAAYQNVNSPTLSIVNPPCIRIRFTI